MREVSVLPILIVVTILFLLDLYTYRGVRILTSELTFPGLRKSILIAHWVIFLGFAVWTIVAFLSPQSMNDYRNYKIYYFLFGSFILVYLPKIFFSVFQLADDILLLGKWTISKLIPPSEVAPDLPSISRARFLYQAGAVVAALPFAGAAYGMLKGRWDFRVVREEIPFPNLPAELDGLRIVQLSDAHVGSFFSNFKPVQAAIELVNTLKPDVLVFTGDLVNNFSAEAEEWIPYFKQLEARLGKFSILGNHDYGDYSRWPSEQDKVANLDRLKEIHGEMGFKLLLNEHAFVERNGGQMAVLGVENWGVKPFPQKGDVTRAKQGAEDASFKLLLSHDPSHWDEVVRKEHGDVDLTLSGHTHGAQFGVELGNVKWSPVKYKYPRWAGLYQEGLQYLYVNRGFGYIGFPGRVGMPPEITEITLRKA